MPEFYRKVALTPDAYLRCISMIRAIECYVYSIYPTAQYSSVWWISDINTPIALFYDTETSGLRQEEMQGVVWDQMCNTVPGVKDFFDAYGLAYTFAKGFDNVYHPHRHTYPLSSRWTLTFLQKNAENSPVKFYAVDDSEYDVYEYQLRPGAIATAVEEVIVDSGEVYSFNAWQWHNWVPKHEKTEYTVFTLANVLTKDQMITAIDRIESA